MKTIFLIYSDIFNTSKNLYSVIKMPLLWIFLMLFLTSSLFGQIYLNGTITDDNGQALTGVTIIIIGTNTGTVTNIDGNYNIQVPDSASILEFSYEGYLDQAVKVGSQTKIDFIMHPNNLAANEMVAVGYGLQSKSDITGSIASVSSEVLNRNKSTRYDLALQAKIAGVFVTQNSGLPGSNPLVQIRGASSLNMDGGTPLYIIDGTNMGNINSVNPEDIESIEILKDASAAGIYGVTAGNGVVLVTTKKGKAGKPTVNFDYYYGVQKMVNNLDLMNGREYSETYNEYRHLTSRPDYYDSASLSTMPNTNWLNEITRNAPIQNINLSASGGSDKGSYMMSLGYLDQKGIIIKSEFERFTIRVNTEVKPAKWFEIGENLSVVTTARYGFEDWQMHNEYNSPITNAIWYMPNIEPYYYDSASEEWNWNAAFQAGAVNNPMVGIDNMNKQNNYYQAYGNAFIKINFNKWLTFKSKLGGEYNTSKHTEFDPVWYPDNGYPTSNTMTNSYTYYRYLNWQNFLNFNKTLAGSHSINIMAGSEAFDYYTEGYQISSTDLPSEDITHRYLSNGSNFDISMPFAPEGNKSYSYFARLNYDYKGKYLLTSNIRYDNSSKYSDTYHSGWFPSFSLGWKFSEEPFIKALDIISFGNIRFGWGQTGNSDIPIGKGYAVIENAAVYNYSFDDQTITEGYGPSISSNYDIRWETINQTNIGIDLGVFQNQLNLTVDWFKKENIGMLISTQTPAVSGGYIRDYNAEGNPQYPYTNVGNLNTSGLEFSIGYKNVAGKLSYEINANLTYIKSMVGNINGDSYSGSAYKGMGGTQNLSALNLTKEGHALAEFYGYEADGIFTLEDCDYIGGKWMATNQPDSAGIYAQPYAQAGDLRFVDLDGNGILDERDQTWIGNPNPDIYAGLTINLSYGIVDFSVLMQGVFGNQIYNIVRLYGYNSTTEFNWQADFLNRYSDTIYSRSGELLSNGNINGTVMRMDLTEANENYRNSSYFVEDGWYIRMKDLQIGINLPSKWMNVIKFNKFRLYGGVQNLFTITEYTGLDPEVASSNGSPDNMLTKGLDMGGYPVSRTWYCGLQLGF